MGMRDGGIGVVRTHYVGVMGRLQGIDPLFEGIGKNIDFRTPFFRYLRKKFYFDM